MLKHAVAHANGSLSIITGRNEVVAKVMLLQVCVWPQGGQGVCLSACWDARPPQTRQIPPDQAYTPRPDRHPPDQTDTPDQADTPTRPGRHPPGPGRHPLPWTRQTPPWDQADTPQDQADTPWDQADTPPQSRLQHTVYEWPVHILLECILVFNQCFIQER